MAQTNALSKLASTIVGLETTFGSTPTTTYRAFPVQGSVDIQLSQTEAENENESVKLYDYKNPVLGLKGGTVKMDLYVRPYATVYSGSNSNQDHYLQQVLKAALGGHTVASGSSAQAGATTTSVVVDHPSRFAIGQFALFTTTAGLEPALITNISSNTLTVTPALTSAPASGSAVANMDNFYPTETNTNTLTIQHAKAAASDLQWTMNGCVVKSLDLKFERDSLAVASVECEVKTWVTGAQSITTAVGSETLSSPQVVKGAQTIFQSTATGTRTQYPLESVSFKLTLGNEFLPELGGTEGATGVMRTGQRPFVEATVKFRADTQRDVDWVNQTAQQLHVMIPRTDSNSVRRWLVASIPTGVIYGKPKWSDTGGRLTCEVTIRSQLNALTTSPSTDLAYSPFICAIG